MTDTHRSDRRRRFAGIVLVTAATLCWSLTGFYTRVLATDPWTTMAGRSSFGLFFLATIFVARHRGDSGPAFRAMGRPGVAQALASLACALFTITSLYRTTVADNAVIGATSPFAAAALAFFLLGERVAIRTVVAGLGSLVGVAVVVSGSLGGGRMVGDLLAVGMMISFAGMIVIARARPSTPVDGPNLLAVAMNLAVTAPFADFATIDGGQALILAAFGLTNFVLAGTLFLAGSSRIPAAESALIVALDLVFSPSVVWLACGEAPTSTGLVGGAIVLVSVIGHIVAGSRTSATERPPGTAVAAEVTPRRTWRRAGR
jgi:drug/metabolite transporter (DMT)-like permease